MKDGGDILILGATGKVGRLVRAHWPASALRVAWQGRSAGARPGWVGWHPGTPLPPARVVVLLSGVTAEDPASGARLSDNTGIGLAVAQAAAQAGVGHILLASTMAVFGRTPEAGACETTAPDGPRPYGQSKLAMEATMAAHLAPTGTGVTALRIGNVAGADLLGDVVAAGRRVRLDRFAGGAGPVRSYAGPRFLARVLEGLAARVLGGTRLPPVLNVAGQHPVGMAEILQSASIPFDWQDAGPEAWQRVTMDCSLLAGFVPPCRDLETPQALAADWRGVAP